MNRLWKFGESTTSQGIYFIIILFHNGRLENLLWGIPLRSTSAHYDRRRCSARGPCVWNASGFVIEIIRIIFVLFHIFIMKNERDYRSWTILQLRTELWKRKVKKTMSRKEIAKEESELATDHAGWPTLPNFPLIFAFPTSDNLNPSSFLIWVFRKYMPSSLWTQWYTTRRAWHG